MKASEACEKILVADELCEKEIEKARKTKGLVRDTYEEDLKVYCLGKISEGEYLSGRSSGGIDMSYSILAGQFVIECKKRTSFSESKITCFIKSIRLVSVTQDGELPELADQT